MSEKSFFDRLRTQERPVVVDFWAPWCGPCRAIGPIVEKLSREYAGRVDVWKINADEQPDVLRALKIYGIPTLVVFRDGKEVTRRTGAASPPVLSSLFEAAISGEKPANLGPAPLDRILRLIAGSLLVWSAYQANFSGINVLLALLGVGVAFSAVYDRCPVYQAISRRVKAWLERWQVGSSNVR